MKKPLLIVALSCALAAGLVTAAFAQMTSGGGAGAGGVSGAKSDATGANRAGGTTASPSGGSTGTGGSGGTTGKGRSGIGKSSGNTSEDRVPHD